MSFLRFLIVTVALLGLTVANAKTTPTVEKQLVQLNKYWQAFDVDDPILTKRVPLNTDVELIRTHLRLVEQHLRKTTPADLPAEQKEKRLHTLAILKDYYQRGIFPKNTYHQKRTPYFIDSYGTACAVGKLMIETGYEDVAKKIARENNFAYIDQMNYPELEAWAEEYGFQVKELKWIQPAYCNPAEECPGTISHVTCKGAEDGCIGKKPTPTIDSPPYSYTWYEYHPYDSLWQPINFGRPCDLGAGEYKCRVVNNVGDTEEFFYTLKYENPIRVNASITHDDGTCNGSIFLNVSGGIADSYHYYWFHNSEQSKAVDSLCEGNYVVSINTGPGICSIKDTFTVDRVTGISKNEKPGLSLYPNPALTTLTVTLSQTSLQQGTVSVYNIKGRMMYTENFSSPSFQLNTAQLTNGMYFLIIEHESKTIRRRFVKNER